MNYQKSLTGSRISQDDLSYIFSWRKGSSTEDRPQLRVSCQLFCLADELYSCVVSNYLNALIKVLFLESSANIAANLVEICNHCRASSRKRFDFCDITGCASSQENLNLAFDKATLLYVPLRNNLN